MGFIRGLGFGFGSSCSELVVVNVENGEMWVVLDDLVLVRYNEIGDCMGEGCGEKWER